MKLVKSVGLFLLLSMALSSCIVAGPGYGRYGRGPEFHRPPGPRGGGGYHHGGGRHHGGGHGHYRR